MHSIDNERVATKLSLSIACGLSRCHPMQHHVLQPVILIRKLRDDIERNSTGTEQRASAHGLRRAPRSNTTLQCTLHQCTNSGHVLTTCPFRYFRRQKVTREVLMATFEVVKGGRKTPIRDLSARVRCSLQGLQPANNCTARRATHTRENELQLRSSFTPAHATAIFLGLKTFKCSLMWAGNSPGSPIGS